MTTNRHQPCGACGDPEFVCPGTLRRFLRCCTSCTHITQNDLDWQTTPPPAQPTDAISAPTDPVLLEAS